MRCNSFLNNKKGQMQGVGSRPSFGSGVPSGSRTKFGTVILLIGLLVIAVIFLPRLYGFFEAGGFESLEEGVTYELYQSYKSGKDNLLELISGERLKGSGDYFGGTREGEYERLGVDLDGLDPLISNVYAGEDFRLKFDFDVYGLEGLGGYVNAEFFCYMKEEDDAQEKFGEISPSEEVRLTQTTGNVYCDISGENTEGLSEAISVFGWIQFPMERQYSIVTYLWDGEVKDSTDESFYNKYDKTREFSEPAENGEPIEIGMSVQGEEDDVVVVREDDITFNTIGLYFRNKWGGSLVDMQEIKLTLDEGLELDESKDYPKQWCPFEYFGEKSGRKEYILADEYKDLIWPLDEDGFMDLTETPSLECELWAEDILYTAPFEAANITLDMTYIYKTATADEQIEISGEDESLIASIEEGP